LNSVNLAEAGLDRERGRQVLVLAAVATAMLVVVLGFLPYPSATAAGYGPGYGTLSGIVSKEEGDPSRYATVTVWNVAGDVVISQRVPVSTSGSRYRIRLLAGQYWVGASEVAASYENTDTDQVFITEGHSAEDNLGV
jgi:hypothetical protein